MQQFITRTCYLDESTQSVVNGGQSAQLSTKQWYFLEKLTDKPDTPISHKDIAEYIAKRSGEESVWEDISYVRRHKMAIINIFRNVGLEDAAEQIVFSDHKGNYIFHQLESEEITPTISKYLSVAGLPGRELKLMVDLMLSQGVSGKMGRHTLMRLASEGNPFAMFEIGELYYYGYITANHESDFAGASVWYSRAAEKNHPGALWTLGYMMMNNIYPNVPENEIDYGAACTYLKRAWELGSVAALTSIGQLYEEGHFPEEESDLFPDCQSDLERAKLCYEQADAQEYHYATNRLARLYERAGQIERAVHCYERSAAMIADGYVYNKLGLFYERGLGCERDPAKACAYYIKAVEGVLPNDVTGWGEFNAGRVYAGRIQSQPARYYDLEKGVQLIYQSLEHLPPADQDQPLCELLQLLIDFDLSLTGQRPRDLEMLRARVSALTKRYMASIDAFGREDLYAKAQRVRDLYDEMVQLKESKR